MQLVRRQLDGEHVVRLGVHHDLAQRQPDVAGGDRCAEPSARSIASSICTVVVLPLVPVTHSHGAASPGRAAARPARPRPRPGAPALRACGEAAARDGGSPGEVTTRSTSVGQARVAPVAQAHRRRRGSPSSVAFSCAARRVGAVVERRRPARRRAAARRRPRSRRRRARRRPRAARPTDEARSAAERASPVRRDVIRHAPTPTRRRRCRGRWRRRCPQMIQNRITIVTSAQPSSSKWCCRGAIRNSRLPSGQLEVPDLEDHRQRDDGEQAAEHDAAAARSAS